MFLNAPMSAALDRIAERAADARRAFTPGALPGNDDVATLAASSDFTLDPLVVSAPRDAYFVTSDDRGQIAYTRNGAFSLRGNALISATGKTVCGIDAGETLSEIHLDAVDASLGRIAGLHIEGDGSLAYVQETVDPRSGMRESRRVVAGRIALARFPAGTKLATSDAGELHLTPGVKPQIGAPKDGRFDAIAPMQRERSRVDIDQSLIALKEAYVAFDALQAAERAKAQLGKTAMDLVK